MSSLFDILFLFSFTILIIGLMKPSIFQLTRKKVGKIFGILSIFLLIISGIVSKPDTKQTNATKPTQKMATQTNIISKNTTTTTAINKEEIKKTTATTTNNKTTIQGSQIKPNTKNIVSSTNKITTNNTTSAITSVKEPEATKQEIQSANFQLNGVGQQASKTFNLKVGLAIFKMTHSGASNFAPILMDSNGKTIELLANEIGVFTGSKAVGIINSDEYVLDITASGNWTIEISQPYPSTAPSKPQTINGAGQSVSPFIYLNKGLTTFKMKHTGKSNFAVLLKDRNGRTINLLANEIGNFDGSKAVGISNAGIYLMDITADGDWEINVQ